MRRGEQLVEEMMRLDEHVRYVAVHLDGHREVRERVGLKSSGSGDAEALEELGTGAALPDPAPKSRSAPRGSARRVTIRGGQFWQVAMACRGGEVSIGVDHGVDPFEVAALASDVLLSQGL